MKNKPNTTEGFTLVEIMIVVAIIGLLATMAIPNFRRSREEAHRVACINNLQHIASAVEIWAMELKKPGEQPVTYTDISVYLKNTVACPAGGVNFADSYAITTVDAQPQCLRKPDTHKLPL